MALPEGGRGSPKLLKTLRVPISEGDQGKIYSVALSPNGKWVAAGGSDVGYVKGGRGTNSVYIFDAATGRLIKRLGGFDNVIDHLAFSLDGSRLVATLNRGEGMRLWETRSWQLLVEDKDYGGKGSYGAAFDTANRLFTVADDGQIRRYGADGHLEAKAATQGGKWPFSIAVHAKEAKLAVGFIDGTAVEVYDAGTLKLLYAANTSGIGKGSSNGVAWSADGARLYAGKATEGPFELFIWAKEGRGKRSETPLSQDSIMQLLPCGNGIAVGAADPAFGLIAPNGEKQLWQEGVIADMRDKVRGAFTVSPDGKRVRFGLGYGAEKPVLFDLTSFSLSDAPLAVPGLAAPKTSDLAVTSWEHMLSPKLGGKGLALEDHEYSWSLAIAPDASSFVLGTEWYLRAYRADGNELWPAKPVPEIAFGVNISRDGRRVVVAYGDGTIRWHRMTDGKELLAVFVHAEDKRYIAWTPKGYYAASPGSEDLIGWHVNRDWDHAPDFFPASRFRDQYNRPDIVKRVLDDLDEDRAIAEANRLAGVKPAEDIANKLPPVITLLSPAEGTSIFDRTLTVAYSVRSPAELPLKNVRALIDGRPAAAGGVETKGFVPESTREQALSLTVEVPDHDFELSLIAEAEGALPSTPVRVRLKWAGKPPSEIIKPKMYALLIGVSRYKDKSVPALKWADKDAEDLDRILEAQKGRLYRDVEVRLIENEEATAARIVDELAWIESAASQGDRVIVFLSGHGVTDNLNSYYFVPYDARMEKRGVFSLPARSTSVSHAQIVDSLKRTQGHVLFFFDTCHAGGAAVGGATRGDQTYQLFIDEMRDASNGVLVLASSEGRELSQEDDLSKNGVFTRAVVEGLSGKADFNKDGVVTFDELSLYVAERVKELTKNTQHPVRDVVTPTRNLAVAAVD